LPSVKRLGVPVLAMTGSPCSTLAGAADVHLDVSVRQEACPLGLAPTASTTAALAMGDALAMALLERRGFTEEDFAERHPGGHLGRRLLRVEDLMHTGDEVPRVGPDTVMKDALFEMTRKRLGVTTVTDAAGTLLGILSDGDLRRLMERHGFAARPHRRGVYDRRPGGHRPARAGHPRPRRAGAPQDHLSRGDGRGAAGGGHPAPARPVEDGDGVTTTRHDLLVARCRRLKLVLSDVDGVMTDGRVLLLPDGGEAKAFDIKDGLGVVLAHRAGLRTGILSGRSSPAVARRAAELGMAVVLQGVSDKATAFRELLAREHLRPEEVAYVGDDVNDLPVMVEAGLSAAPADAPLEVRARAFMVTDARGGRGCLREFLEAILRARGDWEGLLAAMGAPLP
jgi:YrbI family 3-deoxy-D-manno-octulosonate 8-phosphate phosphatase